MKIPLLCRPVFSPALTSVPTPSERALAARATSRRRECNCVVRWARRSGGQTDHGQQP